MAASGITPKGPVEPVRPEPAGRERPGSRRGRDRRRPPGRVAPDDADGDDDSPPPPRSRLDVLV